MAVATPAVVEGGSTPADAIAWSDENEWEPTPHDVLEYARFLGATPDECARDGRMLEVARRGLCAALPPNWRPCKAPDGKRFYFDASVGTSQWEHPSDAIFREEVRRLKQTTTTATGHWHQPTPAMSTSNGSQQLLQTTATNNGKR